MTATEIPVRLTLPKPKTPRSSGVHVSGIIRCIAAEAGILKAHWIENIDELSLVDAREITDEKAILRISIGLAWEQYYASNCLPDVLDHPGEMHLDGIYMTHDGESVSVVRTERGEEEEALIVHEFKATYKSTKTVGDLTTQWMWLSQMMAYCRALGTRFANLHCLFLCGDYKFPISPQLRMWQIEFTEEELAGNWHLLTNYRDAKLAEEQYGER